MKLILLHLSDIHFKESMGQNPVLSRTGQIAAAAASTAPTANCCFLSVTGDIAFSGKQAEYTLANEFFRDLRTHLSSRLSECDFHFVSVPGNHDCDFSKPNKVRELLVSNLTPSGFDEDVFSQCAEVQGNYEEFAAQWRTKSIQRDTLSKVYTREMYDVQGGTVEFRLINSAWMSTLEERQGSLRFPAELFQEDTDTDSAPTLVVTMLHHPYNWFEATNARALRSEVAKTSDIILTGHEHDVDHYHTVRATGERTEYLEGGVLQVSDDPQMSWFNVLVVDLDEEMQEVHTFSWNNGNGRYEPEGTPVPAVFQRNRYRLRKEFLLSESFEKFLTDPGTNFTHPNKEKILLEDLFVYPDLLQVNLFSEEEWAMKVIPQDQVPTFVLDHRYVLLVGPENCGKTTLAKILFRDLRENGFVPIYIPGSEWKVYTDDTIPSSIKRAFQDIYESPDSIAFEQLERGRKAIIVDDFDQSRFNVRARTRAIKTLKDLFGAVVLLGGENLRFDELITRREEEPTILDFAQCQILHFGNVRRADLVKKWYLLGPHFTDEESALNRRAVQAEKMVRSLLGQNFIPSYPIFILILLQNMETYTRLPIAPRSGSYGYLYESLLTIALLRSSKVKDDLDTKYTYLSELAYFLFASQAHSISYEQALDWHQRHCKKYRVGLDFERTLSDLCEASVLCKDNNTVHFRYSYMYYYFVGRYFSEHISQEEIRDHIRSMSKRLHHTESANILVFLSYLSKDPLILSSILDASQDLFSSYPECDLAENNKFLNGLMNNVPQLVLDSSDPEERRRKILARQDEIEADQVDQEEDEIMNDELEVRPISF